MTHSSIKLILYFANRSPEDTWRNLIQELHLTGDKVVHHRLPDEQQAMLERQLGVITFPTYMLVNKQGVIVNRKAGSPTNYDYTASTITDTCWDEFSIICPALTNRN